MTERMDRLMAGPFFEKFYADASLLAYHPSNKQKRTKKEREGDVMSELLVRKARKGDAESFCRLMDMHLQTMYKIAWSYLKNEEDVADVLQETTLACYEKLGDLKQNRYFKTWMTRILINKCKDCLEKRSRLICTDNLPETPVYEADYEAAEWNQLLAPLDEKYRTILLLYYLEGFNTRQISEILEMKESTVKSRLQRGRKEAAKIYSGRYREGEA